ncbi:GTP-binding protein [Prolixibacteraceae bacterium Z1-6]|uniref:GTP-binding protein n=1 Tax=Draconibacterium aestuarii TaxID=2998507 RepID=A0A9X3J7Y1_9BACT|nr:GTP-binding protein [Prolixibacteraceae bacterium Z1-6]
MKRKSKIPVTVITGFLGAGKTTFINYVLQQKKGKQFALVENEFGDVAIDTKLISGVDASQMFELKQGCICCTLTDEYELVLQELAERFPNIEHVLIETTGVADPAPVIQPFFKDENLAELYVYVGTVCLVDAMNFTTQPEKDILLKQLAIADTILVNKSENLPDTEKEDFKVALKQINPLAEISFISYGKANPELNQLHLKAANGIDLMPDPELHAHIQKKKLTFQHPLNRAEFLRWLDYTLDIYKNKIYRTKGILCFQGEPFEYIVQGVGGSFELIEGDLILDSIESQVVFIGKLEGLSIDF